MSAGNTYRRMALNDSGAAWLNDALAMAKQQHDDSLIMETLFFLAALYTNINDYSKSITTMDTAIAMAAKAGNYDRQLHFIQQQSEYLTVMSDFNQSIKVLEHGLTIAREKKAKKNEAAIYQLLAGIYISMNKYEVAFNLVNKSVRIDDSIGNNAALPEDYYIISIILAHQNRHEDALRYQRQALDMASKHGDAVNTDRYTIGVAQTYSALKKYDSAIYLYKDIIRRYTYVDSFILMTANMTMATAYTGKEDYKEALRCLLTSVAINNKLFHDSYTEFSTNLLLGRVYLHTNQLDAALQHALICEKMINSPLGQDGRFNDEYEYVTLLADIYTARGDAKKAAIYFREYQGIQDSLFNSRIHTTLAEQEARFNLSDKNRTLQLLAKENELEKIKGQRQVIALALSLLVVVVIVLAYRRAIRNNKLLAAQKKQIDAQVTQLEAAATLKARFLANISHELRTPATLLTGMLEMVRAKRKNKENIDDHQLEIAYNNSRKLQHMIEEILDLSRVENKITSMNAGATELSPVLRNIVLAFEPLMNKHNLTLRYDDSKLNDVHISIDDDKFQKIINNLVHNAIKFNKPNGAISVTAAQNNNQAVIEIADTGKGIKPTDLPHIFDRFYQGAVDTKTKAEGIGIGLSLVKEFTEMHGGAVTVKSELGKGTTFTLHFPVTVPAAGVPANEEEQLPQVSWEQLPGKQTVLITEDNIEMRYYLREVLGRDVHIVEAANGREALTQMNLSKPDLVITDIMMPEMDGQELVATIKASEAYNKIPIITLTALADTTSQLSMLRLGVDDYIVKPFNADELRIRTFNLLNNFAVRKETSREPKEADEIVIDTEADQFREKIKQFVLTNLKNENISVIDLATHLMMSERQLFRLSKNLTGYGPAQLIKEVRLQKAYELLVSGDITKVDEVARRVGFGPTTYFSRKFLERFGKRPSEFL